MNTLREAFERARLAQRQNDMMRPIYQAIDLGLWPWKPGKVTAWTDQEFFQNGPKLTFEIDLLPKLRFVAYPDVIRDDPDTVAYKIAQEAFIFYRYRPALPVDDHIVLGEE